MKFELPIIIMHMNNEMYNEQYGGYVINHLKKQRQKNGKLFWEILEEEKDKISILKDAKEWRR